MIDTSNEYYILSTTTGRIAYETILCRIHFKFYGQAVNMVLYQKEDDVVPDTWHQSSIKDNDCVYCTTQEQI